MLLFLLLLSALVGLMVLVILTGCAVAAAWRAAIQPCAPLLPRKLSESR